MVIGCETVKAISWLGMMKGMTALVTVKARLLVQVTNGFANWVKKHLDFFYKCGIVIL